MFGLKSKACSSSSSSPRRQFLESMDSGGVETELNHFDDGLSYTSLRDLMPTSRPGSPLKQQQVKRLQGESGEVAEKEVGDDRPAIKNRLVEQAARAYLLPTSANQRSPSEQLMLAHFWPSLKWIDLTRVVQSFFRIKPTNDHHTPQHSSPKKLLHGRHAQRVRSGSDAMNLSSGPSIAAN